MSSWLFLFKTLTMKIRLSTFDDISKEIHLLNIENSYILPDGFLKVLNTSETVNEQLFFLKKFKELYPVLFKHSLEIEHTSVISDSIKKIITSFGEVDHKASQHLKKIRKEIGHVRGEINESFTRALSKFCLLYTSDAADE